MNDQPTHYERSTLGGTWEPGTAAPRSPLAYYLRNLGDGYYDDGVGNLYRLPRAAPDLSQRLRDAAAWVDHHQDTPAPDWEALLDEAAAAIDHLTCICDLIAAGLRTTCPSHANPMDGFGPSYPGAR